MSRIYHIEPSLMGRHDTGLHSKDSFDQPSRSQIWTMVTILEVGAHLHTETSPLRSQETNTAKEVKANDVIQRCLRDIERDY